MFKSPALLRKTSEHLFGVSFYRSGNGSFHIFGFCLFKAADFLYVACSMLQHIVYKASVLRSIHLLLSVF